MSTKSVWTSKNMTVLNKLARRAKTLSTGKHRNWKAAIKEFKVRKLFPAGFPTKHSHLAEIYHNYKKNYEGICKVSGCNSKVYRNSRCCTLHLEEIAKIQRSIRYNLTGVKPSRRGRRD